MKRLNRIKTKQLRLFKLVDIWLLEIKIILENEERYKK